MTLREEIINLSEGYINYFTKEEGNKLKEMWAKKMFDSKFEELDYECQCEVLDKIEELYGKKF